MTEENRFLCFDLGGEEFGIPLLRVREVIGMPEVTPVPQMPSHFVGIMNLRGSVISIMDLRVKMGIKPKPSDETTVIILDLGDLQLGMIVDRVNAVNQIEKDQMSEKPHMDNTKISQSIMGVWQKSDSLVLLLDVAKALSVEERGFAAQSAKPAA